MLSIIKSKTVVISIFFIIFFVSLYSFFHFLFLFIMAHPIVPMSNIIIADPIIAAYCSLRLKYTYVTAATTAAIIAPLIDLPLESACAVISRLNTPCYFDFSGCSYSPT